MKKIVVSIQNSLLAEMLTFNLLESGEFMPQRCLFEKADEEYDNCRLLSADILLMEVSYTPETTLENRMQDVKRVRKTVPGCKIVLLCDENSAPNIAHEVAKAKQDGIIDGFFYSSVGAKYLIAALKAL
ncbi:MAG: response regulator transcription factor [Clostridia bacterium]|nr:response regulator transcription factor [Clostridia bacterium]